MRLDVEGVPSNPRVSRIAFSLSLRVSGKHQIRNIFDEGELSRDSVIKDFLITAADDKKYQTKFYNLDMIISIGYRIKSHIATRFRQLANQQLREYINRSGPFRLNQKCINMKL